MAFGDAKQVSSSGYAGSAVRVAQRWMRELLFEDWTLKLLALAITLGIWYGLREQQAPVSIRLHGVYLSFLLPNEMDISSELQDTVEVTLRGSRQALDELKQRNLIASVDVQNFKPGQRVVQLTPARVAMDLPANVQIEKIEPSTIPLHLEPRIERELEVEAKLEGQPAENYQVRNVEITPRTVRMRGPASIINNLRTVSTETVLLDGRTESFSDPQIAVIVTNRKIVALDTFVTVRAEISKR